MKLSNNEKGMIIFVLVGIAAAVAGYFFAVVTIG